MLDNLGEVLLLVLLICFGKGFIFWSLARLFKYGNIVPLSVGMGLFQVGEFSFVLARVGIATGSITSDFYTIILTATVITMVLTPLVSGQTSRLYSLGRSRFRHESLEMINLPEKGLRNHVVIAGNGRVGFQIAKILQRLNLQFVVIELDQREIEKAKAEQMPVVYGDASHETVLKAAGIETAVMLVVTIPGIVESRCSMVKAKRLNSSLEIVARTSKEEFLPVFRNLEVTEVVLPEFEAGLEMARQVLQHMNIPPGEIQECTNNLRQELFAPLFTSIEKHPELAQLRAAEHLFNLQWVVIGPGSFLIDRSISDSRVGTVTRATIVGAIRNGKLKIGLRSDFRFQLGDLVAIIGKKSSRENFKRLAAIDVH